MRPTLADPRCKKDIQRLNGCIVALGRLVSKFAKRYMSFFKALKLSGKSFQWNKNCTKAWNDLKDYLIKLLLLCVPTPGETLYLYLSVSEQAIASILLREAKTKQLSVYFVSRILRDAEI